MAKSLFANQGFKTLAASSQLQSLRNQMVQAREDAEREKRERIAKIKASHAIPALNLRVKRNLPEVK